MPIRQYLLVLNLGLMNTRWALIFPYAAGGAVFGVFLIRPFSLPEELFEAARIDGAGDWQVFYSIPGDEWNAWPSVTMTQDKVYTHCQGRFSWVPCRLRQPLVFVFILARKAFIVKILSDDALRRHGERRSLSIVGN